MDGNLSIQEPKVSVNITCGYFAVEAEAQAWLVDFLSKCQDIDGGLFFRYVGAFRNGVPIFRHHRQSMDKENYKCDVIALPRSVKHATWYGAIVFEVKRSGEKVGPAINQLLDYRSSVFDVNGIKVVPSFGFLFPCRKQNSAIASMMAHQSLGSACQDEYDRRVRIYSGEERLLEFDEFGKLIFARDPKCGKGSGCR